MGIFGELKNKKKTDKQRKTMQWKRRQRTVARQNNPLKVNLEGVTLFSKDMLKNKMKNVRNNINLSNKKRNRMLKRLRHGQREKDQVEADTDEQMVEEVNPKKSKKATAKQAKSSSKVKASTSAAVDVKEEEDVDMGDESK
eukprot:TRINITY_DN77827_c0_g1_i1.p1 TRINITY_DN77827_c0_g1~~TRINITY_DN77827_c0_g1_i1.p1  ORF type:complete len:141 (-),score=58.15 TRINITY_DN77827_c0_g1_i1:47-469(-)